MIGSLTRIFTTIQEVDDPLILYAFVGGFLLNAVLAFQMVGHYSEKAPQTLMTLKLHRYIIGSLQQPLPMQRKPAKSQRRLQWAQALMLRPKRRRPHAVEVRLADLFSMLHTVQLCLLFPSYLFKPNKTPKSCLSVVPHFLLFSVSIRLFSCSI